MKARAKSPSDGWLTFLFNTERVDDASLIMTGFNKNLSLSLKCGAFAGKMAEKALNTRKPSVPTVLEVLNVTCQILGIMCQFPNLKSISYLPYCKLSVIVLGTLIEGGETICDRKVSTNQKVKYMLKDIPKKIFLVLVSDCVYSLMMTQYAFLTGFGLLALKIVESNYLPANYKFFSRLVGTAANSIPVDRTVKPIIDSTTKTHQ